MHGLELKYDSHQFNGFFWQAAVSSSFTHSQVSPTILLHNKCGKSGGLDKR